MNRSQAVQEKIDRVQVIGWTRGVEPGFLAGRSHDQSRMVDANLHDWCRESCVGVGFTKSFLREEIGKLDNVVS